MNQLQDGGSSTGVAEEWLMMEKGKGRKKVDGAFDQVR